MKRKEYDLLFTCRGNGTGVCNKKNNYKELAHIAEDGTIKYYVTGLPEHVIKAIEASAQESKDANTQRNFASYEDKVTTLLQKKLDIVRGDAQSLAEANQAIMNAGFCNGANIEDTANLIICPTAEAKEEAICFLHSRRTNDCMEYRASDSYIYSDAALYIGTLDSDELEEATALGFDTENHYWMVQFAKQKGMQLPQHYILVVEDEIQLPYSLYWKCWTAAIEPQGWEREIEVPRFIQWCKENNILPYWF